MPSSSQADRVTIELNSKNYGELYTQAGLFAAYWHAKKKQVRKYTGSPYIVHPLEVGKILEIHMGDDATDEMLAAAYLHDVLEDTDCTYEIILEEFGGIVAEMVDDLTDVYTSEVFPEFNRKERKELEAGRISRCHIQVKQIKICDVISNTSDIAENDPNFAINTYLAEKEYMLTLIGDVGYNLQQMALQQISNAREYINASKSR